MSILKYISDEELTRAAKKVGEAIRKSLPDPETCRHEFSPEFQKKIEVLKEQGRRKEQKNKIFKAGLYCCYDSPLLHRSYARC